MASQNEMHQETGVKETGTDNKSDTGKSIKTTNVETKEQQAPPFSEFDPFRTHRISEVSSETETFLGEMGLRPAGLENADENQLRTLSKDAEERQGWSETRSDAFRGVLRLGSGTPPPGS